MRVTELLLIGGGGAAGAVIRALLGRMLLPAAGHFPWHTFAINISGSLALGLLVGYSAMKGIPNSKAMYQFLAIGFLGAYTTFSTFELEIHSLQRTQPLLAFAYAAGSVIAGYAAFVSGMWVFTKA